MQTFPDINFPTSQWDISQNSNLSHLGDDDFLALLAKQYPTSFPASQPQDIGPWYSPDNGLSYGFGGGINPQTLHPSGEPLSLPSLSPPSDDSPSPPQANDTSGRLTDDEDITMLKRKASEEDFEEGPSSKSTKKSSSSRRKSSGSGNPDDARLAKRKEQNRAAQRAFRERKEKHVKDLEDKVAALEAKNTAATSENENLRDLLTRLQDENMALKRQSFTFSVPKNAGSAGSSSTPMFSPTQSQFQAPPRMTNPLDMSSQNFFDPNMLSLLDENSNQQTATLAGNHLATPFGFGDQNNGHFAANFTTIASNPMFLSLASIFEDPNPSPPMPNSAMSMSGSPPQSLAPTSPQGPMLDFDMNNLTTFSSSDMTGSFDDIFGSPMTSFNMFNSPNPNPNMMTGISPSPFFNLHALGAASGSSGSSINLPPSISHADHGAGQASSSSSSDSSSSASSSAGSPASQVSDAGTSATSVHEGSSGPTHGDGCPKTKTEFRQRLENEGSSMFAPPVTTPTAECPDGSCTAGGLVDLLRKTEAATPSNAHVNNDISHLLGPMAGGKAANLMKLGVTKDDIVRCSTTTTGFPKTEMSDKNVPVMSAWKAITQDPSFKDVDINLLCSEFSKKAKCDGTKVVLEPQGVTQVLESLHGVKKQGTAAAGVGPMNGLVSMFGVGA